MSAKIEVSHELLELFNEAKRRGYKGYFIDFLYEAAKAFMEGQK